MTTPYLLADLRRDEGVRRFPYLDSRGNWSIGCGHNIAADPQMLVKLDELKRTGIDDATIDQLLQEDVGRTEVRLDRDIPWWRQLDDVRQDVMVNLAFNLGADKLATWKHTLADIQAGRFKAAEIDLENDQPWASQVHARAQRLALQMETGVRQ